MPLMPRKVKYRKSQRGNRAGNAKRGTRLNFGDYGLQTLDRGWVKNNQIEACRVTINRYLKRKGKVWIRIFPHKPTTSRPLNPVGRTGMAGRGLLGKWGPNHAADPIVTRFDPSDPRVLQMVAIKRKDTGQWAIPGGMVDPPECVSQTLRREFEEEAGNFEADDLKGRFGALCDTLFSHGTTIYRGCDELT